MITGDARKKKVITFAKVLVHPRSIHITTLHLFVATRDSCANTNFLAPLTLLGYHFRFPCRYKVSSVMAENASRHSCG